MAAALLLISISFSISLVFTLLSTLELLRRISTPFALLLEIVGRASNLFLIGGVLIFLLMSARRRLRMALIGSAASLSGLLIILVPSFYYGYLLSILDFHASWDIVLFTLLPSLLIFSGLALIGIELRGIQESALAGLLLTLGSLILLAVTTVRLWADLGIVLHLLFLSIGRASLVLAGVVGFRALRS